MAGDNWRRMMDQWFSGPPGEGPDRAEDEQENPTWGKLPKGVRRVQLVDGKIVPMESSPASTPAPPPTPSSEAAEEDWDSTVNPDNYDGERRRLRDALTVFRQRLMYSFPNIQQLDADQLTLAAGWITDMEAQVVAQRDRAFSYTVFGLHDFLSEVDAGLQELAQLRQAFAAQRTRIERQHRQRIAQIERDSREHLRRQREERRRIWQKTQDEMREMREQTRRERQRLADKNHRDFLRYIRGDYPLGYIEVRNED